MCTKDVLVILRPFYLPVLGKRFVPMQESLKTWDHFIQITLGQCAGNSRPMCQVDELRSESDRAKQDGRTWGTLTDLAGSFDTVLAGHHEIKDDQVWSKLLRLVDRVLSVGGLTTYFPPGATAQESAEALPNHRAIVGNQNPSGHVIFPKYGATFLYLPVPF